MRTALFALMLAGCCAETAPHRQTWGFGQGMMNQWTRPVLPYSSVSPDDGEVRGSDGTFGWTHKGKVDVELRRLTIELGQKGCVLEQYDLLETRADCNGVHVLLRRDAVRVYRLCASGTPHEACEAVWSTRIAASHESDMCALSRMLCDHNHPECQSYRRACRAETPSRRFGEDN
jgi:hypothetical protein